MTPAAYTPRDPSTTVLYQVVADHLETFLATIDDDPTAKGLPQFVKDEFYAYLQCGILAHGFLRLDCDSCPHKMLLAFTCKRRGFCPSCAGRHNFPFWKSDSDPNGAISFGTGRFTGIK